MIMELFLIDSAVGAFLADVWKDVLLFTSLVSLAGAVCIALIDFMLDEDQREQIENKPVSFLIYISVIALVSNTVILLAFLAVGVIAAY